MSRQVEPEFLDDDVIVEEAEATPEPAPSRSGGVFGWLMLLMVLVAFAVFVVTVHVPMHKENQTIHVQLDETVDKRSGLEEELHGSKQRVAQLEGELDRISAVAEELEEAHKQALAEKESALAALQKVHDELGEVLGAEIAAGDVLVTRRGNEVVIDVSDQILFDTGEAELNPKGQEVLLRVAEMMKRLPDRAFQVGGHTDSTPVSKRLEERFPTNWELSTARATNVVRFLEDTGEVDGSQLIAAGFSWHRPAASNRNARGKKKNRRIEIVMLRKPAA